jgi:hypothetical protein
VPSCDFRPYLPDGFQQPGERLLMSNRGQLHGGNLMFSSFVSTAGLDFVGEFRNLLPLAVSPNRASSYFGTTVASRVWRAAQSFFLLSIC